MRIRIPTAGLLGTAAPHLRRRVTQPGQQRAKQSYLP